MVWRVQYEIGNQTTLTSRRLVRTRTTTRESKECMKWTEEGDRGCPIESRRREANRGVKRHQTLVLFFALFFNFDF